MTQEAVLEQLRNDHLQMAKSMASVETEIKSLCEEIRQQRQNDEKLHSRIDKKDDRIRELEKRENVSENRITSIESSLITMKWFLATGIAFAAAIATAGAIFF